MSNEEKLRAVGFDTLDKAVDALLAVYHAADAVYGGYNGEGVGIHGPMEQLTAALKGVPAFKPHLPFELESRTSEGGIRE